jgi:hypothetical protein
MKIKSLSVTLALAIVILAENGLEVLGQRTTTSSSSMFSSGTTGGTSTSGARTFSGTSATGGAGGMGSNSSGMSSLNTNSLRSNSMTSSLGTTTQNSGFIGANTGQTAFVGGGQLGQAQGQQGGRAGQGGQTNQYSNRGTQGNRGNQQQQMGQGATGQNNRNQQTQIGYRRSISFDTFPSVANSNVSSVASQDLQETVEFRLQTMIEKSFVGNKLASKDVFVTFQGNTLVLKGTVATAHARDLAGVLARMEPGVARVQNDLVVQSSETP